MTGDERRLVGATAVRKERPRVGVGVIGPGYFRLVRALDPGLRKQEVHARHRLAGERIDVLLRPDVHRGHGDACGLIVADARSGVDEGLRSSVLHARREGLCRFVVVVEARDVAEGDAVERELRGLLSLLGVDGDECPCVRFAGYMERDEDARALAELGAALDELPGLLAPEPLRMVPERFAAEAARLDVVVSLYAPATLLRCEPRRVDECVQGVGRGGSYGRHDAWFGAPCPRCGGPTEGSHQIDVREGCFPVPPEHGVYRVEACLRCGAAGVVRRDEPGPVVRLGSVRAEWIVRHLVPDGPVWTLPSACLLAAEHPEAAARLAALAGGDDVYARLVVAIGADALTSQWVAGGHHVTDTTPLVPSERCGVCGDRCALVLRYPDVWGQDCSLWVCREHPGYAVFRQHM